jgi:hypothetical protein
MITPLVTQILNGGLIERTGVFMTETEDPFVVFIKPKSSSVDPVARLPRSAYRGIYDPLEKNDLPLVANEWNPFLFKSIDVDALQDYEVYWGAGKLSNQ